MGCGLTNAKLPIDLQGRQYVDYNEDRQSFDDGKGAVVRMISNIDEFVLNKNRDKIMEELGGFRKLVILALTDYSLRIRVGSMKDSKLMKCREQIIEELGGFRYFLIAALGSELSSIREAEVCVLRRYTSLSMHPGPFVSHHIHSVSRNICDLVIRFKWLQREEDTYSPQLDWIQARLIYDLLTENVTQRAVIIRLPFSNRNKCHGVVHGVGARCAGQAILSQSFLQKPFGANEAINQSLFEEMKSVNGIKDDTTIWIDGRDNFKNTARVPQLREINKYDYLLLRKEIFGQPIGE